MKLFFNDSQVIFPDAAFKSFFLGYSFDITYYQEGPPEVLPILTVGAGFLALYISYHSDTSIPKFFAETETETETEKVTKANLHKVIIQSGQHDITLNELKFQQSQQIICCNQGSHILLFEFNKNLPQNWVTSNWSTAAQGIADVSFGNDKSTRDGYPWWPHACTFSNVARRCHAISTIQKNQDDKVKVFAITQAFQRESLFKLLLDKEITQLEIVVNQNTRASGADTTPIQIVKIDKAFFKGTSRSGVCLVATGAFENIDLQPVLNGDWYRSINLGIQIQEGKQNISDRLINVVQKNSFSIKELADDRTNSVSTDPESCGQEIFAIHD